VIADVSGKGIPAAIYMAVSRTLIRATGIKGGSPAECITYSNKLLAEESVDCMFVTVFYGIYNVKTGEIVYCNAGHNPPYILKPGGEVVSLPISKDPIAGAINGLVFHDEHIQLQKGETILLFTDGVTEAVNTTFEEFGNKRLEETLAELSLHSCKEMIEVVRADVASFAGDAEQSDDITVLALKRL
jgi:sigma-B regulation protein RsbU (phosphoserine phosphatase)